MLASFKIDQLSKGSKTLIDNLAPPAEILKSEISPDKYIDGEAARPWVSETAWALYSAYMAIIHYTILQLIFLQEENIKSLVSPDKILTLLKTAIPNIDIKSVENDRLPTYLQILESKLINELQKQISGCEPDQESIKRSKNIVETVNDYYSS